MSHENEARYELERKRREELERKRAAEFAERAFKEILARYQEMKDKNYDSYIPDEMKELAQNLNAIEGFLLSNVFEARNLCYQVQNSLYPMDFLFKSAKEEAARQERLRYEEMQRQKEKVKSELEAFFYKKLEEIQTIALANFGVNELEAIKAKIQNEEIANEEEVSKQLMDVLEQAEERAKKWKAEKLAKKKIELLSLKIDDAIKATENEKFENTDNKNKLIDEMKALKLSLTEESSEDSVMEKLKEIRSSVENSLIDEEVRRETVKAIIKELKAQEFTVEKPQIFGSGKDSYVLVKAKKPSGKQATCKINLEGKLNYRFDKYEGMTCVKDIEKFNVDLEKIYSVKFSDERVIWENPDRLSRTQTVSSDSNRRNM